MNFTRVGKSITVWAIHLQRIVSGTSVFRFDRICVRIYCLVLMQFSSGEIRLCVSRPRGWSISLWRI